MGVGTLDARANDDVIDETWFNDLRDALSGDFVGRDETSGAAEAGHNLGNVLYPWGTLYCGDIISNGQRLDPTLLITSTHNVVSGKTRSTSNQPAFLTPAGAAGGASVGVKGATTSLIYVAAGSNGEIDSDLTVSGLATAPSSNNTCLVNDATAAGQMATRTWGEPGSNDITVDNMGSEITALVGKYAGFKVGTEYFMAYVESSTKLKNAFRGYFYDSSLAPLNRVALSDNDTITLMKAHWIFADTAGTVTSTAVMPKIDATQPSGPATNDYWFDLVNKLWKRYDGAAFQTVSRVLIGVVLVNTADCIAARCVDFGARYDAHSSLRLEVTGNAIVQATRFGQMASVAGENIRFETARAYWDMATDLAAAADMYSSTEQASRTYYLYLKDTGAEVISDISPYFKGEGYGWYHPHNPWRAFALVQNDGSSNLIAATLQQYRSFNDTPVPDGPAEITNLSFTCSVAGNALTIKAQTKGQRDATPDDPIYVGFTDPTTGDYVRCATKKALSTVISSGSTGGLASCSGNMIEYIYVYGIYNGPDDMEIAWLGGAPVIDPGSVQSTTAEGGAGAADTRYTLYSTTARTNKPVRLLARLKFNASTLGTAGTYGSAPAEISMAPFTEVAGNQEVLFDGQNGHGSTNGAIRRYSTITSTGTFMTGADSGTAGMSLTINREGVYGFLVIDGNTGGAGAWGISRNSNQLGTSIASITLAHRLAYASANAANYTIPVYAEKRCVPGDIIRSHDDGGSVLGNNIIFRAVFLRP